jgi:dTDP-4-dehydrorhamnose 3,5-epimerase
VIFSETPLGGAFVIAPERLEDSRGFFARTWCEREMEEHGIESQLVQCSVSFNKVRGTLRGMHLQTAPHEETKIVRCTKGAIFDVIVDLRHESPTFKRHFEVTLSEDNYKMLYVPKGLAHGFLTLEDNTEVFYQMSEFYSSEHARGVRWNDPSFKINWPFSPSVMSDQDRNYDDFRP